MPDEEAKGTVEFARTARYAFDNVALPVDASPLDVERVTGQTIELLTRVHGYADDITVLAAQCVTARKPLDLTLAADRVAVRTARRRTTAWLDHLHVRPEDTDALVHTAVELVQNVVDHAYLDAGADRSGDVTIRLSLDSDGAAVLTVSDTGSWRERDTQLLDRGLGLALASMQVDAIDVQTTDAGTTAIVRHALSRPAGPLTGISSPGSPDRDLFDSWCVPNGDTMHIGAHGPPHHLAQPRLTANRPASPPAPRWALG